MRISKLFAAASVAVTLGLAGGAQAADYAYMTGGSEPWGSNTNVDAMNGAFGAGNWDHFNGFEASVLSGGYDFIYFDGGNGQSAGFNSFVSANSAAIEAFVTAGGHIMANAGRWDFDPASLGVGFGAAIEGDSNYDHATGNASLTAAGLLAGLDADGAGSSWSGGYFAHDIVTGVDACYVSGNAGCVFGSVGEGLFVGGQTNTNFHSGGNPLQLRVNELKLAANGAANVGAVPEPATWALMIGGFGMAGAMLRRRRTVMA